MTFIGMDVEAATGHASTLQSQGIDALGSVISAIDSLVPQLMQAWTGQDADAFSGEWSGTHRVQLQTVQTALVEFHSKLTRNIDEQVATSAQ